jgi:hypothetical protein
MPDSLSGLIASSSRNRTPFYHATAVSRTRQGNQLTSWTEYINLSPPTWVPGILSLPSLLPYHHTGRTLHIATLKSSSPASHIAQCSHQHQLNTNASAHLLSRRFMSCPTTYQHPLRKHPKKLKPFKTTKKKISFPVHLLLQRHLLIHHICALRWPQLLFLPPRHLRSLHLLLLLLLHHAPPTRLFVARDVLPLVLLHSTVPWHGFVLHFILHRQGVVPLLLFSAVWWLPLVHYTLRALLVHSVPHGLVASLPRSPRWREVPDARLFTNWHTIVPFALKASLHVARLRLP